MFYTNTYCTIFRDKWPWGREDWGDGIPYGNTTNPDFPVWKEETKGFVERKIIPEPYWWYAKQVIDGTHNEKGQEIDKDGYIVRD